MEKHSLSRTAGLDPRHAQGYKTELRAACYFTDEGCIVSWPGLTQCKYDLVVDRDGELSRVQVKTAIWNSNLGPNQYLQVRLSDRSNGVYDPGSYDLLLCYHDYEGIWVIPEEEVRGLTGICLTKRGPSIRPLSQGDDWSKFKVSE